jgi:hypothetical protein
LDQRLKVPPWLIREVFASMLSMAPRLLEAGCGVADAALNLVTCALFRLAF